MERQHRKYNLRPLPGGYRRGTSGADAGCHSMRTVGGEELNRRAFAGDKPEGTTAETSSIPTSPISSNNSLFPSTGSSPHSFEGTNTSRSSSTSSTNDVRNTGHRSRPGDRRGTSGADVRRDRIKSVRSRHLRRQATANQNVTAEEINNIVDSTCFPIEQPDRLWLISANSMQLEDVVQKTSSVENSAPTTNSLGARRKWSPKMNKFILRTYFEITQLEQDTNTYLPLLHSKFIENFPEMKDVSRQRVGDQRRAIVNKKLLPQATINDIYEQVKGQKQISQTHLPTNETCSHTGVVTTNQTHTISNNQSTRMRWTNEHNETILKAYFKITRLETDLTTYRQQLHQHFVNSFPKLTHISEQRVADQKRLILKNKYIKQDRLNKIKEEVKKELEAEDLTNSNQVHTTNSSNDDLHFYSNSITEDLLHTSNDIIPATNTFHTEETDLDREQILGTQIDAENNIPELTQSELARELQNAIDEYGKIDPENRPRLPKLTESKKLYKLVHIFNTKILHKFFDIDSDTNHIHTLIYCAAIVISKRLGLKIFSNINYQPNSKNTEKPAWQVRLENDITALRADIGRLSHYIASNDRSRKLVAKVQLIIRKNKVHSTHENNNATPKEVLDTLKQKLALKAHRLSRYLKALQRKTDNKLFSSNEKSFYRSLGKPNDVIENNSVPSEDELKAYWAELWENQKYHDDSAKWIKEEEERYKNIEEMEFSDISKEDIATVTGRLKNWKAAGIDGVQNFWYKKFIVLHEVLAIICTRLIKGEEELPRFTTKGITHLLPKNTDTANPSQYRPITCLPTLYKLITSCITLRINIHLESHNILAEEQKGCRRNHKGCKEQLLIDSTVLKHAHKHNRNIHLTYIDYKKAFDSVPHSWLIRVLQIYKINPTIVTFLENAMDNWNTVLSLTTKTTKVSTDEIRIRNGIFQGDSLSPLWFCLALNPLSTMLARTSSGYKLAKETEITHLMYVDDIKLFAKSHNDMKHLLELTTNFSNDIQMNFGLDKCNTLHIHKGKVLAGDYNLSEEVNIRAMDSENTYKYLGIKQNRSINHTEIKKELSAEYIRRVNILCKKKLNSKNLFKALNTYAVPVLTYSFGVIKWSLTDIKKLQIKTRTTLTRNNYLHPKSAIERMTVKRDKGGRGLIDIKVLWENQINRLRDFFYKKHDSRIHNATIQADNNFTPLNLQGPNLLFKTAQEADRERLDAWRKKQLHGRHIHDLEQSHIDTDNSNKWLKIGYLFPETEGFLIAIQDQVICTKNYRKYILKDPNTQDDRCRKCQKSPETIQHIINACPLLTQNDYTHRHNQVAYYIHQKLAIIHKLIQTDVKPYYQYLPKPVLESSTWRMYFDRAILTDKTIHCNRPDITLLDKTNKTAYLIDIAVPNTHNIQKTISEKIHKYSELKEEVLRIWNLQKVYIVPMVLSSTGVIPKYLAHSIKLLGLPENSYITMQKAAILNTCRIVRRFLQDEPNLT